MFALCARNTQGLFYFHSFLIDMFFSLSFCMTWKKKKNRLNIQVRGETSVIKNELHVQIRETNLCHSHLEVLLGDVNSPFSQSVHPCLCANTLKDTHIMKLHFKASCVLHFPPD